MTPGDVEAAVRAWLKAGPALLSTLPIGIRVPNPRPVSFVRLTRTAGGPVNPKQDRAWVLVECWAADSVAAFALARATQQRMEAAAGAWLDMQTYCYHYSAQAPVGLPDAETTSPRYQYLMGLYLRMT